MDKMTLLTPDEMDPQEREKLVNNKSDHSLDSVKTVDENQITITRHISAEKYSTMCFKAMDKNMIDVIITKGEYRGKKNNDISLAYITSQDIRQKYIGKAKLGVGLVFTLIFVMLAVLIFCLLTSPAHIKNSLTNEGTLFASSNQTILNSTDLYTAYDMNIVNSTSALNASTFR
ncbi:hypothetical protein ACF0H5_016102 [Mactra antiquata]